MSHSSYRALALSPLLSGLLLLSLPARAEFIYARLVPGAGLEANGASSAVDLSSDGRTAVFSSAAQNWVAGDTYNGERAIAVDMDTGVVEIGRYAVVDDVGRVINPMICHGQIEGALAQGIGQALMENVAFDRESGQMLSASFNDYAMPRAADLPAHYELDFIDVPAKTNPLGVKGVGEAGCVGAPPAVMNAILDALRPLGVQHLDMPATPRRVWEALQQAKR